MKMPRHYKILFRSCLFLIANGILLFGPVVTLALDACPDTYTAASICGGNYLDLGDPGYLDNDCDHDGLSNRLECDGFPTLGSGRQVYGYNQAPEPGVTEPVVVDPTVPDLMFIATNSADGELSNGSIMKTALESTSNALQIYAENFNISAHKLEINDCVDRVVVIGDSGRTVRAAKIIEREDIPAFRGGELGVTPSMTTPSDPNAFCNIFTNQIKDEVDRNCNEDCTIKTDRKNIVMEKAPNADILNYYILQIISHEIGHGSMLAPTTEASFYHYQGSDTVMDPNVIYKRGTYTMPNQFNLPDKAALKLYRDDTL